MLKGQTRSQEAIEKHKTTMLKNLMAKYDWTLLERYGDTQLRVVTHNRQHTLITLNKFKEFFEQGHNIRTLRKKENVSKHLIQFFSNFLQHKINLTEEQFHQEYESGKSLDDIASRHSITRGDITFLRQLYGIRTKGAKFIHRKNTEVPLTQRQKEILYGSMMGDACKMSPSTVKFKQGEDQKDYLTWKYKEFASVASQDSYKPSTSVDVRSEKENISWLFYTHANTDVEKCISLFYKDGNKQINNEILNNLTPLSLAVWYMDDGRTDFSQSAKLLGQNPTPEFAFCTDRFSPQSCEMIIKWLKEKYDIDSHIRTRDLIDADGIRIIIDSTSAEKFVKLISPHIIPMFRYKTEYQDYSDVRKDREQQVLYEDLIRCPLGADFNGLSPVKQEKYVQSFVRAYQKRGIHKIVGKPEDWKKQIETVLKHNSENIISGKTISNQAIVGNSYTRSFFPNFWKCKSRGHLSLQEIFDNKSLLADIVRKVIQQGYFPTKQNSRHGAEKRGDDFGIKQRIHGLALPRSRSSRSGI